MGNTMKKTISLAVTMVMVLTCAFMSAGHVYAGGTNSTPAKNMVSLLSTMNKYAKKKNAKFNMISNGGYNLYGPKSPVASTMLSSVNGVLIEDAFTHSDKKNMQAAMNKAIKNKKKAFSIEYKKFTGNKNVISYKAKGNDELNKIPAYTNKTRYDVTSLSGVKNFMIILDPEKYKTKAAYLKAIKNTDYDMVFVDLFYGYDKKGNQVSLTKADVNSLKKKKNGGKRLVCSYMSVGEAENYRYYWKTAWNKKSKRPSWIVAENKEWKGNFKVKYWNAEWKKILYGSSNAYLDRLLAAGFDGVYLDVIDAYEYF